MINNKIENKDWTGNSKSTFSPLGASSHSTHNREEHDYYATSDLVVEPLLSVMTKHGEKVAKNIWENACGELHLSKKLGEFGFNVFSSDLIVRTPEVKQLDFLKYTDDGSIREMLLGEFDIITNPPYKHAKEWVEKSMDFLDNGSRLIMFLKLTFLEGQARKKLFEEYPPKYVFVFSKRQKCAINGDFENTGSSASCYAWFVWEKGYKGLPKIDWI